MIFILNTSEQVTGTLARYGTTNKVTPYFDDKHVIDLSTGAETFIFSTFANTIESTNIVGGNFVAFQDEDGYKLFQISEVTEEHTKEHIKTAYCEMAGIELINEIIRATNIPSASLKQALTLALQDTEYQVGRLDTSLADVHSIELKDPIKVYDFLQTYIIGKYGAEISYRVKIEGGRIVGKYIDCYAERGDFKGVRFEYGKDINKVKKVADFTNIATALVCQGKNGTTIGSVEAPDKPMGQDWIGDEEAYQLYNRNGSHIFDIFKYDTESPAELLFEARKELAERCKPKLKYEVDVELLGAELNIGDTIYIIDNEFLPPLHLSARVSQIQKHRTDPSKDKVILANYKEVVSKITDEDRNLASLIDERFPIGSSDIKDGAVTSNKIPSNAIQSTHIKEDTITTDHLMAKVVTADKIDAGQIYAEHILADQIKTEHLKANSITSAKIQAEAIESSHIKAEAIESDHIKAQQIEAEHIKSGSITTDHIQAGQVVADHILGDQIGANHIKANAITSDKIKAGAITTDKLEANSITSDKLQAGSISTDKLEAGSVTTEKVEAGAINTDKLSANSVNADKLQANAVLTKHIKADQIEANHLKTNSITTNKIQANAITSDKIGANQIQATHIKAGSVDATKVTTGELITTNAQIKNGIIGSAHIGSGQITNAHIGKGAIGEANILDGAITSAKITSASISNAHIKDATIEHGKIKSIDASKISTGTLDASKINVTNLKADSITAGSITVEGANLIHGTDFSNLSYWTRSDGWSLDTTVVYEGVPSMKFLRTDLTTDTWSKLASEKVPCSVGDVFILSGYFYTDDTSVTSRASISADILDAGEVRLSHSYSSVTLLQGNWVRGSVVIKITDPNAKTFQWRTHVNRNGRYWVAKPMVSKGTIASIWKLHADELISDGAITTDKLGDNAVDSTKLNLEELFVSEGAFINELKAVKINASQLEVDTIRNDLINLEGTIKFNSFNEEVNKVLFVKPPNSGQTWINGGMIATDSIKADSIDLLSGLTVSKDGNTTFAIDNSGSVRLKGDVESFNYSNVEGKEAGYKLDPNGTAYFNDAILRGSVILPSAGITNYGGSLDNGANVFLGSQDYSSPWGTKGGSVLVTNETYLGCKVVKVSSAWNNKAYPIANLPSLESGTDYTLSFYAKTDFDTSTSTGALTWYGCNPSTKVCDISSLSTSWKQFSVVLKGWQLTHDRTAQLRLEATEDAPAGKYYYFSGFSLTKGNEVRPWSPAETEASKLIRFWSGSSYEERHDAPFRVYEDGKIVATEGEFGGTFTGELSIGNILIKDTNTTSAEFSIKTNNNAKEVVKLSDTHARFDVDTNIGDVLGVSVGNKQVTFGDSVGLDLKRGKNTIALNKDYGTYFSPLEVATDTGSKHEFKVQDGYSGINFQANGVKTSAGSETAYDYKFSRGDGSSVSVVVEGGLVVKDKITMHDNNKIELVSISGANSGIDFMIR